MTTSHTSRTKTIVRATAGLAAGLLLLTGCSFTDHASETFGIASSYEEEYVITPSGERYTADFLAENDTNGDGEFSDYERNHDSYFIFPIPGSRVLTESQMTLTPEELALGNETLDAYASSIGLPGSLWTQTEGRPDFPTLYHCGRDGVNTGSERCSFFENTFTSTDPAVVDVLSTMFDANEVTLSEECSNTSCYVSDHANGTWAHYTVTGSPFTATTYTIAVGLDLRTDLSGNRVVQVASR